MTAACRCLTSHSAHCFNAPEPEMRRFYVTVTVEIEATDDDAAIDEVKDAVASLGTVTVDQVEEIA